MSDLSMMRGDDETFAIVLVDANGDPFDLTDCDLSFVVGDLFEKTIGAGIVIDPDGDPSPDPTTGLATVTVDAADTVDCPDVRTPYRYDVQVTTATGLIHTPLRGRFIVVPDVPRE
jgi:hypothetical protein